MRSIHQRRRIYWEKVNVSVLLSLRGWTLQLCQKMWGTLKLLQWPAPLNNTELSQCDRVCLFSLWMDRCTAEAVTKGQTPECVSTLWHPLCWRSTGFLERREGEIGAGTQKAAPKLCRRFSAPPRRLACSVIALSVFTLSMYGNPLVSCWPSNTTADTQAVCFITVLCVKRLHRPFHWRRKTAIPRYSFIKALL